jgi:nitroimidazol reductase NimA-like FMN-containing flavoprotein (pyridoxamine 5'-phosphate oxidase superfamily)
LPSIMRRQDKALSQGVAEMLLESGEYGVLSTMGEDGYPYGVPISFSYSGGVIYIHSASEGHKVRNIGYNERVSFCVVGFTQVQPKDFTVSFASVIAFGRAHRVDGEEKKRALEAIAAKYTDRSVQDIDDFISAEGGKTVVFRIDVEGMSAKGNLLLAKANSKADA